jgi:peptide-methionine (S)-S-oxide reductase
MKEIATLAGGCFWCTEAVFDQLKGVESVESGYIGGARPNPTYEEVCTGASGHAEAVQVTFDPEVIAYEDLLAVFFATHDPTQLNRQGNDVGTQYRSAIFYHSEEQKRVAQGLVARLTAEKLFPGRIVTEIVPASPFFVAEDYHQEYFARVGRGNPYCSAVIEPKVAKFRKSFVERLKR